MGGRLRHGPGGIAAALLCMVLAAGAARADTTAAIAYSRHGDIQVMAADGTGKSRLTRGAAWDKQPVWSPDGTRIAFVRCCSQVWRPKGSALMVMHADGTGLREVSTDLRGTVYETAWSPDGRFLLYSDVITTPEGRFRGSLRVADPAGTQFTALTGYRFSNVGGQWSPDGSQVLFMSDRDGDVDLYLTTPDGSHRRRLTDAAGTDSNAMWSPDGTRVAFARTTDEGFTQQLHVVALDGSEQQLTEGDVFDIGPAWSPDGTTLAFLRLTFEPEYDSAIWTVPSAGGEPVRVVAADGFPAWSPDGLSLAFERHGNIVAVAADGSGERPLTDEQLWELHPAWRPTVTAARSPVGVAR